MKSRNVTFYLLSSKQPNFRQHRQKADVPQRSFTVYTGDETSLRHMSAVCAIVRDILEKFSPRTTDVWVETESQFDTALRIAILAKEMGFEGFWQTKKDGLSPISDTPSLIRE